MAHFDKETIQNAGRASPNMLVIQRLVEKNPHNDMVGPLMTGCGSELSLTIDVVLQLQSKRFHHQLFLLHMDIMTCTPLSII